MRSLVDNLQCDGSDHGTAERHAMCVARGLTFCRATVEERRLSISGACSLTSSLVAARSLADTTEASAMP
jgi:hypothetical protein